MRLLHLCLLNGPKIEDNRLVKLSKQNYSVTSSFQYLNLGIGRFDTPSLVAGRAQDLGHESVRNIETQIAGIQRRNNHAQSQTRSEQFLVIGIDSRVCLPGFGRSQSHRDDGERKAGRDSGPVKH